MGKKNRRRPAAQKNVSRNQQVQPAESNDDERNHEESNHDEQPRVRPPSIHELDDLKAAVAWMEKGRVDTKGFAKYLPYTAKSLQEGKVTPEEVTRDLEDVYTVTTCKIGRDEVDPVFALVSMSATSALPYEFFHPRRQLFKDTVLGFTKDLESELMTRVSETPVNSPECFSLRMKESIDTTCEKWAPRLDRELFHGRKGSFLNKCPLYDIDPEEYNDENMPFGKLSRRVDFDHGKKKKEIAENRQHSILMAAKNAAKGFHDISQTCWECKTVCQDLKSCARCHAAQYCSKECQRSAWNKGHKHKCDLLSCKYAALDDGLKTLDEYHSGLGKNTNFFSKNEFILRPEADFRTFKMSFDLGGVTPIVKEKNQTKWGIPSMQLYYENLERIIRGEFWFFPNSSESRYRELGLDTMGLKTNYSTLAIALCFDCNDVLVGSIQEFCDNCFEGVGMPSSIFLRIYQYQAQEAQEDSADRFRLRRECKLGILQHFMENLHT